MTSRTFQVRFTRTSVQTAETAQTLAQPLLAIAGTNGENLPEREIDGHHWQIRELVLIGTVWKGAFARLRDDAPHVVDIANTEHELELEEGDRIVDKVYFLYYSARDALVWQYNQTVCGLTKFENYLQLVLGAIVELPSVIDAGLAEAALDRNIHELQFTYARPTVLPEGTPSWKQDAFDLMSSVHGAVGKFVIRAKRSESLGGNIRDTLLDALASNHVKRVKIKFTDEPGQLYDLVVAPIKDQITVPMAGRYPVKARVFEELADAYERQVDRIPQP
jgi:hypothetical protein